MARVRGCFTAVWMILICVSAFAEPAPAGPDIWSEIVSGHDKCLALSFDDGLDPRKQPMAGAWNAAILHALAEARVTAIFFPAGKRVDSPEGLELVRNWGEAGHRVANHTYSHLNFGAERVTLEAFIADTQRNERLLQHMPGWTKRLRFPFLKEGETAAKRDAFRKWLTRHGYKPGAVSIDASDWYYNQRYLEWRKTHPDDDAAPFRTAYLEHLWDRTLYYEALANQVLHRSVKHVLLLHVNAINAVFLPDIIAMYRAKGWRIIPPQTAYADPVYTAEPRVLPAGESLIWALAKQHGVQGLRYPAESAVYEKSLLDALGF